MSSVSPSTDTAKLKEGDQCPHCKEDGQMVHRRHRFSSDRGPNMPDADWLECDFCGFYTDPE